MGFDLGKLGVKRNIPKVNFTDYTGIFVCPPKWGKTTIASMFPKAIIAPFEKGFNAQVVNFIEDMNSWDNFVAFVDKLEKHRAEIGNDLQTIVFDTVNEAYELCLPYMLKKESLKSGQKYTAIGDLPFGQGYAKLDQYFKLQIDRIQKLGFAILFISHSKVKNIKPKTGEPYDTYTSTMSERLEKIIYPLVDYIIFGEKKKVEDPMLGTSVIKRCMIVSGNNADESQAGSRLALKGDIVFDTEEEAVALFQQHFQSAIEEKIRKAGITKDIKEIAKEQADQKAKDVQAYVDAQQAPNADELVAEIKSKFASSTDVQKTALVAYLSEKKIANLSNLEQLDIEVLLEIKEILV
jgi:hypothetical protein